MKKSLLSLAAVAAVALSANAQDALYATGDFAASNWNPTEPVEFTFADDVYTLTVEDVSMLKVSTVKGEWEEFNGGCLQVDGDAQVGENALIAGDGNIVMPWSGEWTLVINKDLTTLTLSTTTPEPVGFTEVYLRGVMNDWGTSTDWQFATVDGNVYVLAGVSIEAGVEFKVADAKWSAINYGYIEGVTVEQDEETELVYNGPNIVLEEKLENGNLVFTLDAHTLLVTNEEVGSLAGIVSENVAPVYYNLNGMQVANPTSGLYIKKQNNKVSKVYIK